MVSIKLGDYLRQDQICGIRDCVLSIIRVCSKASKEEKDKMEGATKEGESLPPGFRFHPTDEELITYYLTQKISESNFSARAIADVDLNKCEPWDLPSIILISCLSY